MGALAPVAPSQGGHGGPPCLRGLSSPPRTRTQRHRFPPPKEWWVLCVRVRRSWPSPEFLEHAELATSGKAPRLQEPHDHSRRGHPHLVVSSTGAAVVAAATTKNKASIPNGTAAVHSGLARENRRCPPSRDATANGARTSAASRPGARPPSRRPGSATPRQPTPKMGGNIHPLARACARNRQVGRDGRRDGAAVARPAHHWAAVRAASAAVHPPRGRRGGTAHSLWGLPRWARAAGGRAAAAGGGVPRQAANPRQGRLLPYGPRGGVRAAAARSGRARRRHPPSSARAATNSRRRGRCHRCLRRLAGAHWREPPPPSCPFPPSSRYPQS